MNHQFPGSRSPGSNAIGPFYNPQKDAPNPNNPTLYQPPPQPTLPFPANSSSKSYIARSNIMDLKPPANNTSAYVKNPTEGPVGPGKFGGNNVTSPTSAYSSTNYQGFTSPYQPKLSSEMVKSLIHENAKLPEQGLAFTPPPEKPNFLANTPTRRAPRMSEPLQFDNNPTQKPYEYKTNNDPPNDSPGIQKRFREPKDFENQFFKHRNGLQNEQKEHSTTTTKFQGSSTGKSEIWSKGSLGKKRAVTVNDFKKIKQLGSGKYGQVSLVQQRSTGFICALKMIEKKLIKEQEIVEQFIREMKIQLYLNHPNIIKMYGYFDDQTHIFIIMEVGTGGQLFHQLKRTEPMQEAKVAPIIKQVCDAVNEIHSLRIIHRDIKPENIVIHDNVIKLCDFGWSVYQDNKLRTTFCGTPLYVCPEILKGKEYDEKIDIWSLGIMMYEMLVGENPFKITRQEELIKIVKDEIAIPSYVFVSREARDFLDKCLKKNPNDRVNIKELLNHDFLTKNQEKAEKKVAF